MRDREWHRSEDALRQLRGGKWARYGAEVLPVWVADMDFRVADPVQRAVERLVDERDYGYHSYRMGAEIADGFARHMAARFGWQVEPSHVIPVSEILQSIQALIHTLSEPGDGVVVQTPIYPPFFSAVHDTGRTLVENRLVRGPQRYEMDLDALRAAADGRTRILLLCNPHNPTGRAFERAELEALAALAVERDWLVIADEVHADLTYPGHTHIPFGTLGDDVAARTVTVTSATKAFNFAGLRCAVMYFGAGELFHRFTHALPRTILGEVSVVGADATVAAWDDGRPWLDAVLRQLDANRAFIAEFLGERLPDVVYQPPDATYLAWLDCSALELPDRPSRFFYKQAKVAFSDGILFGTLGEQFVRLNFATMPDILERVLTRCADAVAALGRP